MILGMNEPLAESISEVMSAWGKKGGKAKSEAKATAARKNAKLGGWPKGKPRKPKKS